MGWRDEGVGGEQVPEPCEWGADVAMAQIEDDELCGHGGRYTVCTPICERQMNIPGGSLKSSSTSVT